MDVEKKFRRERHTKKKLKLAVLALDDYYAERIKDRPVKGL
ncbi:MAG: hypothetical protein ACLR1S_14555 [Ruminococcus bicirculans (ex Wegman et al. 2014)]